ncbi:unnamed protein product [Soboliphyme baturini]|uniref:BZIP domain-containing protein n=1 Tax=Soboliphyme baturini TaxID=241478 RepID=A0A183IV68_9BILA|nr:unnamed protein product [Soboliphyme baturini]
MPISDDVARHNSRKTRHSHEAILRYMRERRENDIKREKMKALNAKREKAEREKKLNNVIRRQRQLASQVVASSDTGRTGTAVIEGGVSDEDRARIEQFKIGYETTAVYSADQAKTPMVAKNELGKYIDWHCSQLGLPAVETQTLAWDQESWRQYLSFSATLKE